MQITCIEVQGTNFFLVVTVGGVVTLRVPILPGVAQLLLAIGVPQCEE
ncbi:exosporium protein G [Bacillus manliponensis]|uniref:Exosporium protein G n=1 Tax=Bacillus manliponensis TaxID=574376 RepID=A0A073JVC9_9BACI|nr:hypothetical protein [Bacillus manliponensis]KEK18166.1 exosporium protein G [Bacillus manliponensis]